MQLAICSLVQHKMHAALGICGCCNLQRYRSLVQAALEQRKNNPKLTRCSLVQNLVLIRQEPASGYSTWIALVKPNTRILSLVTQSGLPFPGKLRNSCLKKAKMRLIPKYQTGKLCLSREED